MLRLSEHYVSTQGEGQHTGVLTQFVRFAGCNMRCPGWPCDTEFAIDPKIWRKDSVKIESGLIANKVRETYVKTGAGNVCLTGGEPFLQNHDELQQLVVQLVEEGLNVEAFTNGSFIYPDWAIQLVDFMMDWKLAGSGEAFTNREQRLQNALKLKGTDGIKFVVKDRNDLKEATELTYEWMEMHRPPQAELWVGSAWDQIRERDIVQYIIDNALPWKLNVQVHKYVWPADERGV